MPRIFFQKGPPSERYQLLVRLRLPSFHHRYINIYCPNTSSFVGKLKETTANITSQVMAPKSAHYPPRYYLSHFEHNTVNFTLLLLLWTLIHHAYLHLFLTNQITWIRTLSIMWLRSMIHVGRLIESKFRGFPLYFAITYVTEKFGPVMGTTWTRHDMKHSMYVNHNAFRLHGEISSRGRGDAGSCSPFDIASCTNANKLCSITVRSEPCPSSRRPKWRYLRP